MNRGSKIQYRSNRQNETECLEIDCDAKKCMQVDRPKIMLSSRIFRIITHTEFLGTDSST